VLLKEKIAKERERERKLQYVLLKIVCEILHRFISLKILQELWSYFILPTKTLLKSYTEQNFEYLFFLGYVVSIENCKDLYKTSHCEYRRGENTSSLSCKLKKSRIGKTLKWMNEWKWSLKKSSIQSILEVN